jgi:hypothetical protein
MNARAIWKFIMSDAVSDITMPAGARVLYAREQLEQICVWADVDPGARRVSRRFLIAGTGHPLPADVDSAVYLGSAHLQGGMFGFHVYDRGEVA